MRLALQKAVGLKLAQDGLGDQELSERLRLGTRVGLQELTNDLIELAAVDEIAPTQIPNEPFASSKFGGNHDDSILCVRE